MKGKWMFQFTDMSNTEEQIAQHVLEIRLEMGLTQEQFAAKLGVSFPTVNRWENKKTKPSPLAIQKLQKLLSALKKKKSASQESIEEIKASDAPTNKKIVNKATV
jgi:transcriptional regulator with XRE-family HTH domain